MTDVITAFMAAVPSSAHPYYEESTESAVFPYCIASGFDTQDLDGGFQMNIDIDHWTDEGVGHAAALEAQCDTVRLALDQTTISKTGSFRAVIYFESQAVIIDGEQDLIRRRQTYIVRAFLI